MKENGTNIVCIENAQPFCLQNSKKQRQLLGFCQETFLKAVPRNCFKAKTSQECSAEQRLQVASSFSSSSSSSSSTAGASPPSSSPSGDSGSPAFLPGLSPNHLGSLLAGLLVHSSYFSFQIASNDSALMTSQPPSYSFFLSS